MTMTGNPHHDPAQAAAPTDRELLTGQRAADDRRDAPKRPAQTPATNRELDQELADSMDASDPPSLTQP